MKTVGEILKNARTKKDISKKEIAKKTKINLEYIKALEDNDFKNLPESAFVKGFIRNYANVVDLNPEQALAVFRRDYDQDVKGQVVPRTLAEKKLDKRSFFNPKTTIIVSLSALFIVLFAYLFYQYRLLAAAPPLEISNPEEGDKVRASLTITGKTDPQATLTINNQQVSLEPDGSFSQPLVLTEGTRTITIKSTSRSGKVRSVQRTVNVEL